MSFEEKQIDELRQRVQGSMSQWRFTHTAEVEKMAVRLGELYAPQCIPTLRVAALLHDITKEQKTEEQLALLAHYGIRVTEADRLSPKTLHARTAEQVIKDKYEELATPEVLSAVRRHTTADPDMTLCDALIYLADYIDMSRKFDDCVYLRNYFWDKQPEKMTEADRLTHLWETIVLSLDMTLRALIEEGSPISPESVATRNILICRLKK